MSAVAGENAAQPVLSSFAQPVQELIRVAKSHVSDGKNNGPAAFLQQLRKNTGGTTSNAEFKLLNDMKLQGLPDEVQNILLHYVLVGRKNAVLNPAFLHQLSNECLQNKIFTAEAAVIWFQNRDKKNQARQSQNSKFTGKAKVVKPAPAWSNANYVEQTPADKQAKFAEMQAKAKLKRSQGSPENQAN